MFLNQYIGDLPHAWVNASKLTSFPWKRESTTIWKIWIPNQACPRKSGDWEWQELLNLIALHAWVHKIEPHVI